MYGFPHSIDTGNLVKLGKCRARRVVYTSPQRDTAVLIPVHGSTAKRRVGRSETVLFFDAKRNVYRLQGSEGRIVGQWSPSEVQVF